MKYVAVFVVLLVVAHPAYPQAIYCEVSAAGTSTDGTQSFSGSFTDDGIDFYIDWRHSAPGVEFVADTVFDDLFLCREDGLLTADFTGTGTYNSIPNYSYVIEIEDNRPAPDRIILTASITRQPIRRSEGLALFPDTTRTIRIPSQIRVTAGSSGNGWTKLHLDDVTCRYRGTGSTYDFRRCTGPLGSGLTPGMNMDVASARLRIQKADNSFDLTSVEVDIGTGTPAPGVADHYSLSVFEPGTGVFVFGAIFGIENGDIAIVNLGPKPSP